MKFDGNILSAAVFARTISTLLLGLSMAAIGCVSGDDPADDGDGTTDSEQPVVVSENKPLTFAASTNSFGVSTWRLYADTYGNFTLEGLSSSKVVVRSIDVAAYAESSSSVPDRAMFVFLDNATQTNANPSASLAHGMQKGGAYVFNKSSSAAIPTFEDADFASKLSLYRKAQSDLSAYNASHRTAAAYACTSKVSSLLQSVLTARNTCLAVLRNPNSAAHNEGGTTNEQRRQCFAALADPISKDKVATTACTR